MKAMFVTVMVATAMAVAAAPVANAAHHHAKAVHHAKAGCKGEFMYMKGGKCLDARAKT